MEMMSIDQIQTDNKYLRLDTNVEKLMKSIETVGLINPLIINEDNELIAGGRRFSALKELGKTEAPVFKVKKDKLEQELISIDENLVRLDLKNVEFEQALGRGKEIYETLYPEAKKFDEEDLTIPEDNELQKDLPNEKRSFIDITAEKTGLSKRVIKSAIEREQKSSDVVKKLRSNGDINASQTNEIIKLEKDHQEKVAAYVTGKSAKEIKNFVKSVNELGLEDAIDEAANSPVLPKEYKSLSTLLKRVNKNLNKILLEEIGSDHEEVGKILELISTFRISADQFMLLCAGDNNNTSKNETTEDYNYQEIVAESDLVSQGPTTLEDTSEL